MVSRQGPLAHFLIRFQLERPAAPTFYCVVLRINLTAELVVNRLIANGRVGVGGREEWGHMY